MDMLAKEAQFVPPDAMGGAGAPPPPGGDPGAAGAPPMDPSMDPSMMGGDPAAAGAPPMDPSMMGGDPAAMGGGMPPMDPSMMGMDPSAMGAAPGPGDISPSGEPYMKITPSQLSKLFKQFAEVFKSVLGIGGQPGQQPVAAPQPPVADPAITQKLTELNAKVDAMLGVGG